MRALLFKTYQGPVTIDDLLDVIFPGATEAIESLLQFLFLYMSAFELQINEK